MLTVMDDYGSPRVQAHAGAALVNFSEDCPKNILAPYLDLIIAKLEQVLTATFKQVHVVVGKLDKVGLSKLLCVQMSTVCMAICLVLYTCMRVSWLELR